ncbi:MAG: hypothetical protein U0X75_02730 [Acidobacteriota bacterium]
MCRWPPWKSIGAGRPDTEDVCDRLFGCSLLWEFDLGTRAIRLHDVIRTFLRDEGKAELANLNVQLLDVHRPAAGWGELVDGEPYCWDHLAEHLIEANAAKSWWRRSKIGAIWPKEPCCGNRTRWKDLTKPDACAP